MRTVAIGVVLLAAGASSALAQEAPFDTAGLATGPHAEACMLLERTIFQVDVLTVHLRLGPVTAERVRTLAEAGASRDSIAAAALGSTDAWIRIEFVRDVGMDRFLEGVREDLRRTVDAGLVDGATFREISSSLPRWYSFLEGRGVREGDALLYRIRGDTLHSGYRAADGALLLRQTDVGRERRLAVLGSYLVEGSSFREGLVDSFMDDDGC